MTAGPDIVGASAAVPSSHSAPGMVEVICGCMFAGKTTALIRLLRGAPAGATLVIKHVRDTRYSPCRVMTHDGDGCEAVCVSAAQEIRKHVSAAVQVVGIDEGHFYDAALAEVCGALAAAGKRVVVATLDLDMWGRPFPSIERLKAIAGVVRVQHAICARCARPATRTYRKTPMIDGNLVGGAEDFEPRCADCWSPPPSSTAR